MTEFFDAHRPATAFDHDSTLVVAMELSGKSWQLGAVIPGVSRRAKVGVKARDMNEVMRVVDRGWKRRRGWCVRCSAGRSAIGAASRRSSA